MTDTVTILLKVTGKAVKGGLPQNIADEFIELITQTIAEPKLIPMFPAFIDSFIFSHSFLQSYFGTHRVDKQGTEILTLIKPHLGIPEKFKFKAGQDLVTQQQYDDAPEAWLFHAQPLVSAADRVMYLARFL